jgi:hypothetical protein
MLVEDRREKVASLFADGKYLGRNRAVVKKNTGFFLETVINLV